MRRLPVAALLLLAVATPAQAKDYAARNSAYSILNPGQSGGLPTDAHSTDQADMYNELTPELGNVSAAELRDTFKPNVFGLRGQRPAHREKTTNDRVRIRVDRWGVPHITAKRRKDVMFGAGWMIAKDRYLLLELARPLARLTILDPPGINAFGLVTSLRSFEPTAQADEIVDREESLLERSEKGRQILKDMRAYMRGVNAQYRAADRDFARFTLTDFIAASGFIGSIFGRGGGDEARRSLFLDALRTRLGDTQGTAVWNDLRNFSDPEAPTSVTRRASWGSIPDQSPGSVVLDDGSFEPIQYASAAAAPEPRNMSNALLVSGRRSKSGHPLFVAGPQLGTFYPALVYEMDMHGGGIDARGASIPGAGPYVFIGRNQDFAWSLTSANNDIIDTFAETLCGSDTKYMYKGECRDMTAIDAGVLKGNGSDIPDQRLTWNETVHGPVIGYATVDGERVALSRRRSTRGREVMSMRLFHDLNSDQVKSGKDFLKVANELEHTFNVAYADEQDIALFSTCRCPKRAPGVDPGLPTRGTGEYEWRGYLKAKQHPSQVNPGRGFILNWNNKPAPGWGAADSEWGFGSVFRSQLFEGPIKARRKHTLASVVGAMNQAATQDHRAAVVLDAPIAVLDTTAAPNPRAAQMLQILKDWRADGSVRIDADLDGFDDDPGVAILDAWWPKLADAVMTPVLGDLTTRLAELISRGKAPDGDGNQSTAGWAGYVDKDLRTLLGRDVDGEYDVRYCGAGDMAACAADLWASLDAAGAELEAEQGTADPVAWRKSTEIERIKYVPGLIDKRIEFTNRPTFQQAISFRGGRK